MFFLGAGIVRKSPDAHNLIFLFPLLNLGGYPTITKRYRKDIFSNHCIRDGYGYIWLRY